MNRLVSVIVPVYNVEKYLGRCLESIMAQSYNNIEIIVVNDGSLDNSPNICQLYAKLDSRIKVFHKRNGGLSDARNYGINVANGDFLMFVDSDDYIANEMVEKLYNSINATDSDIVGCKIKAVSDNIVTEYDCKGNFYKNTTPVMSGVDYLKLFVAGKIENATWNKIYKKSCFDNVKFRVGRNNEDFLLFYELCPMVKKITFIDYFGYYYCQREGSIVHNTNNFLYFDIIKNIEEVKNDIFKNKPYLVKSIEIKELEERIIFMKQVLVRHKFLTYFSEFLKNYMKLWKYSKVAKELPPNYRRPYYLLRYIPLLYSLKS